MAVIYFGDYIIEVDKYNFATYQMVENKKTGKKTSKTLISYFGNMKHAMQRIVLNETRPEVKESAEEFLKRYEEIEKRIDSLIDNMIIEKKLLKSELITEEELNNE